jgi:uncharacterized protein (TIGR03435 family)
MALRSLATWSLALLLSGHLQGQSSPTFEVASVKPSQPGASRGGVSGGGERLVVTAWTLSELMVLAYGQAAPLRRFQISGGPDWLDRERFDITATVTASSIAAPTPFLLQDLMKALLVERFKLVVREETKEAPIYILSMASRDGQLGLKLRRAPAVLCPEPGSEPPPPPPGAEPVRCDYRIGYGTLTGRGVTIRSLSMSMANFYGIGRIVEDRTGLTGGFDMDMEWAPLTQFRQPGNLDPPPDFADRSVNALPTIFVALKEQLGLVLEPGRGPVRSIVIERAERPTPD